MSAADRCSTRAFESRQDIVDFALGGRKWVPNVAQPSLQYKLIAAEAPGKAIVL